MHGKMSLENYVRAKEHLLKVANLVAPNCDVKRSFVAQLNDFEDTGEYTRWEIIHALVMAVGVWTELGRDCELTIMPQNYDLPTAPAA